MIFHPFQLSWNNVYTKQSNVSTKPALALDWFQILCDDIRQEIGKALPELNFDSLYCQLYPDRGGLNKHFDIGVKYGGSVSLGGSSSLNLYLPGGKQTIRQKSGDVIITNFGEIEHEVAEVDVQGSSRWKSSLQYPISRQEATLRRYPKATDGSCLH